MSALPGAGWPAGPLLPFGGGQPAPHPVAFVDGERVGRALVDHRAGRTDPFGDQFPQRQVAAPLPLRWIEQVRVLPAAGRPLGPAGWCRRARVVVGQRVAGRSPVHHLRYWDGWADRGSAPGAVLTVRVGQSAAAERAGGAPGRVAVRARFRRGLGAAGLLGGVAGGADRVRGGVEGVAAQDRGEHRGEVLRPVHPLRADPSCEVGGSPPAHQGLGGALEPAAAKLVDAGSVVGTQGHDGGLCQGDYVRVGDSRRVTAPAWPPRAGLRVTTPPPLHARWGAWARCSLGGRGGYPLGFIRGVAAVRPVPRSHATRRGDPTRLATACMASGYWDRYGGQHLVHL